MPELPEVETTLQAIKKFKNQNLNDVKIYNRNLRWKVNKNLEKKSRNKTLKNLSRRAKYIIFELDDACLLYTSPSPRDVEESRMPSSA